MKDIIKLYKKEIKENEQILLFYGRNLLKKNLYN